MSDEQQPIQPQPQPPSVTPPEREPWTTPTLESLDVSQTTVVPGGTGLDGGSPTALS
jgi:hypothetical protein